MFILDIYIMHLDKLILQIKRIKLSFCYSDWKATITECDGQHTHTHHIIILFILYNITLFLGRQCGWTDNAGFNWTRTILLFENIFIKCSTQIWDFSSAKRKIESLRWAYVVVNSYPVVRDLSPVWPFMHGVSEK